MAKEKVKGGIFLLESPELEQVFVPEEFTEEQRMFAKTAEDFIWNEVVPKSDEIEAKNDELHKPTKRIAENSYYELDNNPDTEYSPPVTGRERP